MANKSKKINSKHYRSVARSRSAVTASAIHRGVSLGARTGRASQRKGLTPWHLRRKAKLALIPHAANQYRPHIIRRYGIALVLAVVMLGGIGLNVMTHGSVLGESSDLTANGLLAYTNTQRINDQEQPLQLNSELMKAAQLKVNNMFADQYWAHTSPQGVTPWHWFGVVGYSYSQAGENLAKDFTTNDSTVAAWMASPEHRANILNSNYQDVGFAIAHGQLDGRPTTLVVAEYGDPLPVAGVEANAKITSAAPITSAPSVTKQLGLIPRFELGVAQITPVAITAVIVLLVLANLALLAQAFRDKLPKELRHSWWYKHHGIYKALGLACMAVVVVLTYGSAGQI